MCNNRLCYTTWQMRHAIRSLFSLLCDNAVFSYTESLIARSSSYDCRMKQSVQSLRQLIALLIAPYVYLQLFRNDFFYIHTPAVQLFSFLPVSIMSFVITPIPILFLQDYSRIFTFLFPYCLSEWRIIHDINNFNELCDITITTVILQLLDMHKA